MGQKVGLLAGDRVSQCLLERECPDHDSLMSMSSSNVSNVDNTHDDDSDDDTKLLLTTSVMQVSSAEVHPRSFLCRGCMCSCTPLSLYHCIVTFVIVGLSPLSLYHCHKSACIITFATSSSQKPSFRIIFAILSELPESASSWTQQCSKPQRSSG